MRQLTLPCFAKVNWILKILGRRKDGFHQLRTLYQTVDLQDEISLTPTRNATISLEVQGQPVPADSSNLVYQAAELLRESTGRSDEGVRLLLRKRIPVGAGLGGGSSNAAVTLLGLNQLWNCGLSDRELSLLAEKLGSDVPFFLVGGMALGEGRGEIVSPLRDPSGKEDLILLFPRRSISSRDAYQIRDWGRWKGEEVLTKDPTETTIQRFCALGTGRIWDFLENDFETALFERYSFLREAAEALRSVGCERVMLCGSGSTVMGLGQPSGWAESTRNSLDQCGDVFRCKTVSRRQYRAILHGAGLCLGLCQE